MKKRVTQWFSILLACCTLLSCVAWGSVAAAAEGAGEIAAFAPEEIDHVVSSAQDGEAEQKAPDAEEAFPDGSAASAHEGNPNLDDAPPEGNEETPPNSLSERMGNNATLGAIFDEITDEQIILEEAQSATVDFEAGLSSGEVHLLAGPTLKASPSSSVTVTQGNSAAVRISFSNFVGRCYLKAYSSTKTAYSLSWGEWSGFTIPLRLQGLNKGNGKVTVYLIDANSGQIKTKLTLNVTVCAPSLKMTESSVNLKVGESYSVKVSSSGYSGAAYLRYGTTNSSAFSCSWVYSDGSRVLKITGKRRGSGSVRVYYTTSSGVDLADGAISVRVTDENPKLTLSSSSLTLAPGATATVNATYSGYSGDVYMQYGNTGGAYYTCKWGQWQGNTIPLKLTGLNSGSGKVTVYLKRSSDGATLDKKEINPVTVRYADNPQISLSSSDVTVKTSESKTIYATVSGVTGSYYVNSSESGLCDFAWGAWSQGTIPLRITGKKSGTSSVNIRLYRSNGELLKTTPLHLNVLPSFPGTNPTFAASPSSVSVGPNATSVVRFTYGNYDRPVKISGSYTGGQYFSYSWGSWSGNSVTMYISGKAPGNGSVTVDLKDKESGDTLKSLTVPVVVGPLTAEPDIRDIGYSFRNFGKSNIPLRLCQFVFGYNERAEQAYRQNIGAGGCCFGFAASALLIIRKANDMSLNQFSGGYSRISDLSQNAKNAALNLSAEELIEAMQVSQIALTRTWGEGNVAKILKRELDAGRYAQISIRGPGGGHALVAYGYQETDSGMTVMISDSNHPLTPQKLYLTKTGGFYNGWSYAPLNWGSGKPNAKIGCLTIDDLNYLWNNRGNAAKLQASDDPIDNDPNYNLLITDENDFEVYYFSWESYQDELMLRYEDGQATYQNENFRIEERPLMSLDEMGDRHFIYMPDEYYTVKNTGEDDKFSMTLVNFDLSATMEGESREFEIVASDAEKLADVILHGAEVGQQYSISIGSTLAAEREEYKGSGVVETPGNLGLSFSNGQIVDEDNLEDAYLAPYSVHVDESGYTVNSVVSEGGSVFPSGSYTYAEGDICQYTFTPDEGYALASLSVNGKPLDAFGNTWSMEFQSGAEESYTLEAVFKREISSCEVTLLSEEYPLENAESPICPVVSVKTPDGQELQENADYRLEYVNNRQPGTATVYVYAVKDGAYAGFAEKAFRIYEKRNDDAISNAVYDRAAGSVNVEFASSKDAYVFVAFFGENGQQATALYRQVNADETSVPFQLSAQDVEKIPEQGYFRVFLTGRNFEPLASAYDSRLSA